MRAAALSLVGLSCVRRLPQQPDRSSNVRGHLDHEHFEQTAALAEMTRSIFAPSATTKADNTSAFPLRVQESVRCALKRRRRPKPSEVTSSSGSLLNIWVLDNI